MALAANQMLVMIPGQADEVRDFDLSTKIAPTFQEVKALLRTVLGDCQIEHVTVLHDDKRRDMFCDEDFQAKGLPRNPPATAIYRAWTLSRDPKQDPERLPAIHGAAVLFGRQIWF